MHLQLRRSLLVAFALKLAACGDPGFDLAPVTAETPEFLVPLSYAPDAGEVTDHGVFIKSSEFGVHISADELASAVDGYERNHFALEQDVYVIVFATAASVQDELDTTHPIAEGINKIWTKSGSMELACVAERPDPITGYLRYYTYCDPEPHVNSNFFLLDEVPNADQPPPETSHFIRATCRDHLPAIRRGLRGMHVPDEQEEYIGCIVGRRHSYDVKFQYRIRGSNLAVIEQVSAYIDSLIGDWKLSAPE